MNQLHSGYHRGISLQWKIGHVPLMHSVNLSAGERFCLNANYIKQHTSEASCLHANQLC